MDVREADKKRITGKKIIITVVLLIIVYAAFWTAMVVGRYARYSKALGGSLFLTTVTEGEYTYSVEIPPVFTYTGNLAIARDMEFSEEGGLAESSYALIIWPGIFKETEYGIIIHEQEDGSNEIIEYQIMIDEEGNPLDTEDEQAVQVCKEHQNEIEKLLKLSDEKWNIRKKD